MGYFALTYEVVPDFITRRTAYRDAHLRLVREANGRGLLMLAGALGDPPDGALLVFRADSASPVEAFARVDPYVVEGLVTAWRVRPWNVVVDLRPAQVDPEPSRGVGAEPTPSKVL